MYHQTLCALLIFISCFICNKGHKIWNILNEGAIPNDKSISTCNTNTKIITELINHQLQSGDTLLIPNDQDFWFNGGIYADSIHNITIQIDGSIHYQNERKYWPTKNNSDHVLEAMQFTNSNGITFTSSNTIDKGLINGHGDNWWGTLNYCIYGENRPRLLHVYNSTNILIEYLYFKDSPYWNVYLEDVKNVEIHHSNVSATRDNKDYHDYYDITAFNTDGFDIAGDNVWIHDVEIWNDDDCIAVKPLSGASYQSDCSRNMLFERINASGVGLTIGSVAPRTAHSCVDNITFRDSYMYHTWKGIYMKSAPGDGTGMISNVLYENITMDRPTGVPIWLGPQQAIYHNQCSLTWPTNPFAKCPVTPNMSWQNITLRNIWINNPKQSPGVILGNNSNPMTNIIFDHVVVTNPGSKPWGKDYYKCDGVKNFKAINGTDPIPKCPSMMVGFLEDNELDAIPGYDKVKELMECMKAETNQLKQNSNEFVVEDDYPTMNVMDEVKHIEDAMDGYYEPVFGVSLIPSYVLWILLLCTCLGSAVYGWRYFKRRNGNNSRDYMLF